MLSTDTRREELKEVFAEARTCTRCPQLAATRTQVVFGAGNADADLMFVGEAPGAKEDERGLPFVGAAGKMLEELLAGVGLRREDVFIANVLKCLRYDAMVQLGDGSWERIGRLVRSRYSGSVMSVDDQGRLVPRRVTGWHATPLGGRTVHRLTYRSATRAGAGRVGIELTGDHPVLTERGYVRADELIAGDRVATGQAPSRRVALDVAQDRVVAAVGGGGPSLDDGAARAGDAVPVAFDDVEVEDVTDRTPGDATVFCIDVEDTHNFVTAGGVVHNCRPPGNRDPAPVEIENCQEYLLRQVELIQPKVICTLGNFSTKLLRGDPTGITRVHGRRERRVFGTRAVWLYPIHHPAAALYTRSLQDTLREDFARLPAILAGPPPEQPDPEPEPEPEPGPQPEPEATASPDLVEQRPADAVAEAPTVEQLGLF